MTAARTAVTIAVLLFATMSAAAAERRQVSVEGQTLVVTSGNERLVVRTLPDDAEFQGYGFIGADTLFLAYSSGSEGGAGTMLAIYDLARQTEYPICEIGGTGESVFVISDDGSTAAFNWIRGIYVFSLKGILEAVRERPLGATRCEKQFRQVVACEQCYSPKWIGPSRLQYEEADGKCWRVRTIDVPAGGR